MLRLISTSRIPSQEGRLRREIKENERAIAADPKYASDLSSNK